MISSQRLYDFFQKNGVNFFTGIPDSLLKHFLKYVQDHTAADMHIITANEGLAVGLASGYYLNTGKLPLVYLQNSGLGNIINPLTSLADKEMYSIPMILLIGWRGKPGIKDEPQHKKMGRITCSLLDILEIPIYELSIDEEKSFEKISAAIEFAQSNQTPVALLVTENLFDNYSGLIKTNDYSLQREDVLNQILKTMSGEEVVICSTGKIGREFYEQNIKKGEKISRVFLSVGAMGHANHIALGLNLQSNEKIIMLDGDGALLMHLGAMPTLAHFAGKNFKHIVINNGSHESVGGQPTEGFAVDFCAIAKACGFKQSCFISNQRELTDWLSAGFNASVNQFVEIRTGLSRKTELGRPAGTPLDWKNSLMNLLKKKS